MLAEILIGVLASEGGGGSLIDVNPGLIFWTWVTFIFLMIVLYKIAWKPILAALKQREEDIKDSLQKAEQAKLDAEKILEENQANLAKAEEESKKIIDQSRSYAENLKEQILKESREQAQKLIKEAGSEIERRKESAFEELKDQIADLAVQAAEKIIKENLDKDKNTQLVNKYLSEINKN